MGGLAIRQSHKAVGGTRLNFIGGGGRKVHTSVLKEKENVDGPMLRFIF
jgi:hypothetical protein